MGQAADGGGMSLVAISEPVLLFDAYPCSVQSARLIAVIGAVVPALVISEVLAKCAFPASPLR